MTDQNTAPRVFGRRLAREMTQAEIERVNGAHGESGGGGGGGAGSGTIADACQAGTLTGQICDSRAPDPLDAG